MNIHPIIVHFPIACLVLYTILEVLSLFKTSWREKLLTTKIFLLTIGVFGAFVAIQTGEIAQESMGNSNLLSAHKEYAQMAYKIYLIILILYVLLWEKFALRFKNNLIYRIISFVQGLHKYGVVALLALLACILLSIAGALGGAISHGSQADPIVKFVYDLIIK